MGAVNWQEFLKAIGPATGRVRLGPGVVGRTTTAAIIALVVLGIVAWNLTHQWLLGGVAALGFLIFIVYFIGVMHFAGKHPAAALLEGSEFLKWQQDEWVVKGVLGPPTSPRIIDPRGSQALPPPPEDNG